MRIDWLLINCYASSLYPSITCRQTPSTPGQQEAPLQAELLPELSGSAQSPLAEHLVAPPSTVDTAALSEEPLPGEGPIMSYDVVGERIHFLPSPYRSACV